MKRFKFNVCRNPLCLTPFRWGLNACPHCRRAVVIRRGAR
jgi:hypothetical protein